MITILVTTLSHQSSAGNNMDDRSSVQNTWREAREVNLKPTYPFLPGRVWGASIGVWLMARLRLTFLGRVNPRRNYGFTIFLRQTTSHMIQKRSNLSGISSNQPGENKRCLPCLQRLKPNKFKLIPSRFKKNGLIIIFYLSASSPLELPQK